MSFVRHNFRSISGAPGHVYHNLIVSPVKGFNNLHKIFICPAGAGIRIHNKEHFFHKKLHLPTRIGFE